MIPCPGVVGRDFEDMKAVGGEVVEQLSDGGGVLRDDEYRFEAGDCFCDLDEDRQHFLQHGSPVGIGVG